MAKRKHWTQLPENKAKLRKQLAKAARTKAKGRKTSGEPSDSQKEQDAAVHAYAFGHVEAWLEVYARSHGLSPSALTHRVARLLLRSAGR